MLVQQNYSWHKPYPIQHWLPHLWLPAILFIGFFIWLKPFTVRVSNQQATIHVSLQKPTAKEPDKTVSKPAPSPQITPATTPTTVATTMVAPTKPDDTAKIQPPTANSNITISTPTKPKISSGELFNQAKQHTDIRINDDFKAATSDTYKAPALKTHDPYANIPYLPTAGPYRMDLEFYATGIEGDIERFFDKVILKKSFTTKYGTKIDCALMVVVVCSWK